LPAGSADPAAVTWFARAAGYLRRPALRCPAHKVAHTGKLARGIVLDLCLLGATGDEQYWRWAVERARYVVARAAPDPEHGGLVYLPGRFDPRNCSNSVIDSGECTDALARLLLHPRAADLPAGERDRIGETIERNAETYLRTAVVEKEITNQRLWGAMGLASACRLMPRASWRDALDQSIARSLGEQREDGSWGYQPDAARHGAFAGAADLTVYYHGRCLAFLLHALEAIPGLPSESAADDGLRRGLAFLDAVTLPSGLKPLALEGKRWFWDGTYEAGSNAYDVFALIAGAARYGEPSWRSTALRAWRQLRRHQQSDGSILACLEPGNADFVCPDFHTADLAWPAQVIDDLATPDERETEHGDAAGERPDPAEAPHAPTVRYFPSAGVVRIDSRGGAAIARTTTLRRNSQWGGAVGGGTVVAADRAAGGRSAAGFTLYGPRHWPFRGLKRFVRDNPPGREGRQWLFVARLLAGQGRMGAALRRLWSGYLWPAVRATREEAAPRWAAEGDVAARDGGVTVRVRPAYGDGSVPRWCGGVEVERTLRPAGETAAIVRVDEALTCCGATERPSRVAFDVPDGAADVQVDTSAPAVPAAPDGTAVPFVRRGTRIAFQPRHREFRLRVSYTI
jgi:hypothetical protein